MDYGELLPYQAATPVGRVRAHGLDASDAEANAGARVSIGPSLRNGAEGGNEAPAGRILDEREVTYVEGWVRAGGIVRVQQPIPRLRNGPA